MFIIKPLSCFDENSYYAIASYDTQVNKPHKLSTNAVMLVPNDMFPIPEQHLRGFQGRVIYYSHEKSLRQVIAETLPQQYPQIWSLGDEKWALCANQVRETNTRYLNKTILQRPDGKIAGNI